MFSAPVIDEFTDLEKASDAGNNDIVAKIGDQGYTSLQDALNAAVSSSGNVSVELQDNISLSEEWVSPSVNGSINHVGIVTINGNGKEISGLTKPLFSGTWAGNSGLIIRDLTIKASTITDDENDTKGTVGVGAFIGYPQASETVILDNCHLINSTVKGGHWTGGLIGMAGGYSGNDGPVYMNLQIKNCSVIGSTIEGKGSAGGIIGHASCDPWTMVDIQNTTLRSNQINSTGTADNKAGTVMGTVGAAGTEKTADNITKTGGVKVNVIESGNNVISNATSIKTVYGRQGSDTGRLIITGGEYANLPINEADTWAGLSDNLSIYEVEENGIKKYTVRKGSYTVAFENVESTITSQTVSFGGKVTEPTMPVKERYDFAGWYVDENYVEKYDFNKEVTKDLTLYAKWEIKPEYAIARINDDEYYDSLNEAIDKSVAGDKLTLLSDVNLGTESININKNITLDLNGKTLSGSGASVVNINEQANTIEEVNITDSATGGIIKNTSNNGTNYSVVLTSGSLILKNGTIGSEAGASRGLKVSSGTSFEMTGGEILSAFRALVAIGAENAPVYINISGGRVVSADTGIYLLGNYAYDNANNPYTINANISGDAIVSGNGDAKNIPVGVFILGNGANLYVNGGSIYGTSYGIMGNGSYNSDDNLNYGGTKIGINDGNVSGGSCGIYQPQNGDITINGGTIEGKVTGIEIRSGNLTVNGGNVIGKGNSTVVTPNNSGATTDGVGIAIAQHTTKFPINVKISDGNISGYTAIYESNPQRNESEYIANVKVDIAGGQFKAINGGSVSVYSEDETGFISGGYFSHMPDKKYAAAGKKFVASTNNDYPYTIGNKTSDETTVETAVLESEVKAEPGTNPDVINAAKSLKAPGLEVEAKDSVPQNTINEAKETAKNNPAFKNVNDENLKVYSTIFFDITVNAYDSSTKELKLNITPMTQLVVSTADSEEMFQFNTDTGTANNINAVKIGNPEPVKNLAVKNLQMSLELPTGFLSKNTDGPIYVEHTKDGTVYRYTATVTESNGKLIATFTNPHGFSSFTFRTTASAAAIGETSYATIAAAITAANNSTTASTIKLLGDVTEENAGAAINIPEGKNITLDLNGYTLTGNITNNGSLTITDSKGNGKIDGTVTSNKTATISSGSVNNVTAAKGTVSVNGGKITDTLTTSVGATTNVSNGTVNNIKSLGTTNIYGGNINGKITKTEGSVTGTINAYGGTYTDRNKTDVIAASGYYFDGNTIRSIPAPSLSSNNYLSGLTVSQGTLTPAFDRNTTAYTVEVENTIDSITVTPVKDSNWASLKVNDKTVASGSASEAIKLSEGANKITVRVTAENGSTKDYTITVTRKAAPGEEYTKLQKAVADYETYKKDGYTESSWAAFEKALKEAQEALKDTSLSEEKAKEILANLTKAAGELQLVGTPVIESVKVSGNKATAKLTGVVENAEGYDYVIGKKDCITTGNYADVRKNKGTATKFSYVQKGTYYAYCHAWKKVNGKKVFSEWSAPYKFTVKVTTVSAPKILSVKVNGRTVTVTLKNGKGIAGVDTVLGKTTVKDQYGKYPSEYELVSKNKTTTTIIFKNVPKGTYYVGAHEFKRYGSSKSKVFSKWSNIKKVVVK